MKWFIYVIMVGLYADGTKDTYLFTQPTLPTLEACQQYVYEKSDQIRMEMMIQFRGKDIERIFCIEEKKLKEYFEAMEKDKQGNEV